MNIQEILEALVTLADDCAATGDADDLTACADALQKMAFALLKRADAIDARKVGAVMTALRKEDESARNIEEAAELAPMR